MSVSKVEKICLEDAFSDSPQLHSLGKLFEEDAQKWKSYIEDYQVSCQRLCNAQMEIYEATRHLFTTVSKIEFLNFPLNRDEGFIKSTMAEYAAILSELNVVQRNVATGLTENFLKPVNKILTKDFENMSSYNRQFRLVSGELDHSMESYMRLPVRATEQTVAQCSKDVEQMRRKHHSSALTYYSGLNSLQLRTKEALLTSISNGLTVWHAGSRALYLPFEKDRVTSFEKKIKAALNDVSDCINEETHQTQQLVAYLREDCSTLYSPVLSQQMLPSRCTLGYKAGYLYQRHKAGVLNAAKWQPAYFFTQAGNLMIQGRYDVAGSPLIDLNEEGVTVEKCDYDDRRHLFQINAPSQRRPIILQCENEKEITEWIATITNIMREGGYVKRNPLHYSPSRSSVSSTNTDSEPSLTTNQIQAWLAIQPIQFELTSNAFPTAIQSLPNDAGEEEDPFASARIIDTFQMRFIGCIKVNAGKGEELVTSVIRHMMGSRAAHDLFRMTDLECHVTSAGLQLVAMMSSEAPVTKINLPMSKVSYWCSHRENFRLFGLIAGPDDTIVTQKSDAANFICYAFECDNGSHICRAIRYAKKQSDPQLKQETNFLLESIMKLPDKNHISSSPVTPTPFFGQDRRQGDTRTPTDNQEEDSLSTPVPTLSGRDNRDMDNVFSSSVEASDSPNHSCDPGASSRPDSSKMYRLAYDEDSDSNGERSSDVDGDERRVEGAEHSNL